MPWILRAVLPPRHRKQVSVQVPFGERLAEAIATSGSPDGASRSTGWGILPGTLWVLVLVSLARPQWIEPPISKTLPTRDMLLLVDLSGSMQQQDFTDNTGKKVDRLTAVKQVLGEFLVKREGDRVGLVVFGDAAYLQAPFSTDLQLCRQLLDECEVGMAGPRTAIGDAIGLGVNLFDSSDAPAKTIIALTDGNDTKSKAPPIEAARVAAQRDIHIHTIAIGDATTVGEDKLDEQTLRDVASAAGGSYFFAADRSNLIKIYDQLDEIETRQIKTISLRPRKDIYYLPLSLALALSLISKLIATCRRPKPMPPGRSSATVYVDPVTGKLGVDS
ncbi:VWA domain-containing protein [Rubripirellula lacrimiformis]|uniref:VWA domain-containing protein n=1 Tax=Rubripirellula lacrimiformis TaxID=1930273 RepID=UPI001FEC35C6|nr:VWA domain-containing protein [Rubripirellula lacrimiformis]